jgi:predicted nucleic acid-binding Zn ribbon protein
MEINVSKYERYKKKTETYIFPHKHCKKCGEMISEGISYCPECYQSLKEKKKRRLFKRRKKKS